ncbi:MAG: GNAT family N-acetyltransferase [Armatimonadota bacterium]|nr:GNAT family N-acetyltransferase [Armatimonadota bacterium]MDR7452198.1 GNAT family N-acetyltransferase [Armatimonadota bacterium]MDR7468035.1 GNAT family N-acetyltransferase [Armatimonadota bacterium]MDR7494924.1 GNAT family N-acetyltransferase [Armatimonadota bacterium]MDR7500374.1 GNAT family N-acetyltransferase [Armatimonadota bacterium]
MDLRPVVLDGGHVRLEPLSADHLPALIEAGLDPDLWRWTTQVVRSPQEMAAYVAQALTEQAAGRALPFAIVARAAGRVVGSTRFGAIEPAHRRVEIGWTWIARPWQRTAVNTEAKYLMLRHAFESWHCLRVEFKTDALNLRSRQALRRIGAKEEGVLRSHLITATGRVRDSIYFSIIAEEWPAVRAHLEEKLRR